MNTAMFTNNKRVNEYIYFKMNSVIVRISYVKYAIKSTKEKRQAQLMVSLKMMKRHIINLSFSFFVQGVQSCSSLNVKNICKFLRSREVKFYLSRSESSSFHFFFGGYFAMTASWTNPAVAPNPFGNQTKKSFATVTPKVAQALAFKNMAALVCHGIADDSPFSMTVLTAMRGLERRIIAVPAPAVPRIVSAVSASKPKAQPAASAFIPPANAQCCIGMLPFLAYIPVKIQPAMKPARFA